VNGFNQFNILEIAGMMWMLRFKATRAIKEETNRNWNRDNDKTESLNGISELKSTTHRERLNCTPKYSIESI
jgi:hypothetical protein